MYLLLLVLWLIFNGSVTVETVLFGVALTALIGFAAWILWGYGFHKELRIYRNLPLFAAYLAVLLFAILKANLMVFSLILFPGRIKPALVRIEVDLKTEMARYILANSITLTPGTITAGIDGDILTVHCLDGAMGDGIEDSVFVKLLQKMEEVGGV